MRIINTDRRLFAPTSYLVLLAATAAAGTTSPTFVDAQSQPESASTYALKLNLPVTACGFDGAKTGATPVIAPAGAKFFWVQPSTISGSTDVVIQFLRWTGTGAESKRLAAAFNTSTQPYFCMARSAFDRFADRTAATGWRSREVAVGALVLPVKLRAGANEAGFDFSSDVAFGTTAGLRTRISDRRETFLIGIVGVALSSVDLTAENTGGTVTEATNRPAFTWTTGALLEVNKFQFGVFLGQDRISQPKSANWAFQGKTWWGFGLGYTLFGASTIRPATDQSTPQ